MPSWVSCGHRRMGPGRGRPACPFPAAGWQPRLAVGWPAWWLPEDAPVHGGSGGGRTVCRHPVREGAVRAGSARGGCVVWWGPVRRGPVHRNPDRCGAACRRPAGWGLAHRPAACRGVVWGAARRGAVRGPVGRGAVPGGLVDCGAGPRGLAGRDAGLRGLVVRCAGLRRGLAGRCAARGRPVRLPRVRGPPARRWCCPRLSDVLRRWGPRRAAGWSWRRRRGHAGCGFSCPAPGARCRR